MDGFALLASTSINLLECPAAASSAANNSEARSFSLFDVHEALRSHNTSRGVDLPNPIPVHQIHCGRLEGFDHPVAVKRIHRPRQVGQMVFMAEVSVLRRLVHPRIARLIGYCWEDDQSYLIYDVRTRGSLAEFLHGQRRARTPLDFDRRMRIAQGVAQALEYLHNQLRPPVVHVGLQSSNVLIGLDFETVLCDVSLLDQPTGYFDREILELGLTPTSGDVQVFGVLLLEMITGKRAVFGEDKTPLVDWARRMLMDKEYDKMVDEVVVDEGGYESHRLDRALELAEMCLRPEESKRPAMDYVVRFFDVITDFSYVEEGKDKDGSPSSSPSLFLESPGREVTLEDCLHGRSKETRLDWNRRMDIALDVARGLDYLHNKLEFSELQCWVGLDYTAELSEVGLILGNKPTGYFASEIMETGLITKSDDVYGFGVLLLEIITGKKAVFDKDNTLLVDWARSMLANKGFNMIVDDVILDLGGYECYRLDMALELAWRCIQKDPLNCPSMADVVRFFDVIISFDVSYSETMLEFI